MGESAPRRRHFHLVAKSSHHFFFGCTWNNFNYRVLCEFIAMNIKRPLLAKCFFITKIHQFTLPLSRWLKSMRKSLNCFLRHPLFQTYSPLWLFSLVDPFFTPKLATPYDLPTGGFFPLLKIFARLLPIVKLLVTILRIQGVFIHAYIHITTSDHPLKILSHLMCSTAFGEKCCFITIIHQFTLSLPRWLKSMRKRSNCFLRHSSFQT